MKINAKVKSEHFPAPDKTQVLALRNKGTKRDVLVYCVPTPRGDHYLFAGEGSNSYLVASDWHGYMNAEDRTHNYELIGLYSQNIMEVTFNA